MKWLSKTFTFVVIPDANQSVQRYRMSGLILFLVPTAVILLAICAALFIYLFSGRAAYVNELQAQLSASQSEYELQLTEKEELIAILQTDLLELAEQADTILHKMDEINELELQLKEIAGIETSSVVRTSSFETEEGGQGGEELPLYTNTNSSNMLVIETLQNYTNINDMIEVMKPSLEATKEAVLKRQQILKNTPTIWPADSRKITSLFGVRKDPFTRRTTYHSGLDIGGKRGEPIYAAADGTVTLSEKTYPQGNNIMIDHGRGIKTRYLHLDKRLVDVGDKVVKGQLIGELGNTGRSTGPHLHYEVSVNGTNVNPMNYIKEDRKDN